MEQLMVNGCCPSKYVDVMASHVNKINKEMNEMYKHWYIYHDHRHVQCAMCIQYSIDTGV